MIKFFSIIILPLLISCKESRDNNTIIVATSADNPPYEFIKGEEVVGIDIDIIKAIALEMDKKLIIKNMEFQSLLAALASNSVNAVIAGMTITPERMSKVDFSVTYDRADVAAIFLKDYSEEDLSQIKIGAQIGSYWYQIAKKISNNPDQNIKILSNNFTLIQELKNNRIDAVIMEENQVEKFKAKNPDFKSIKLGQYYSEFAVVLPKSVDKKFKDDLNKIIIKLRDKGAIEHIKNKWLKN